MKWVKCSDRLPSGDEVFLCKRNESKGFMDVRKEGVSVVSNDGEIVYPFSYDGLYKWEWLDETPDTHCTPFQLCPKCNGQGIVSKPPHIPGDVHQWSSTSICHTCDVCNGNKIIPMLNIPNIPHGS